MTVSPIEKKIQNLSLQSVLNPKWFSTRGDYMETPKKDNGGIETKRTIKVRKQSPDDKVLKATAIYLEASVAYFRQKTNMSR